MLRRMKTLLLVGLVAGSAWAQAEKETAADVKVHVLEERDAKTGRLEL